VTLAGRPAGTRGLSRRGTLACALAIAGAAALASVSGCASDVRDEQARELELEGAKARQLAMLVGASLAVEADVLAEARAARREPAIEVAVERLKVGGLVLEALEEAEFTFAMAHRFREIRDTLELPAAILGHLDGDVAKMVALAKGVEQRAKGFVEGQKGGAGRDIAALAGLRTEIERDRLALKAYRTDIGLTARVGVQ